MLQNMNIFLIPLSLSLYFLLFFKVYQEFDRLLEDQSPIEAYIEWLDSMVERCVVRVRVCRSGFHHMQHLC